MLTPSGLTGATTSEPATPPAEGSPWPLDPGSPAAVALFRLWSGERVTVINAPPGSGKTHTIVGVVTHLVLRKQAPVTVLCPTKSQALGVSVRLAAALPPGSVHLDSRTITDLPAEVVGDSSSLVQVRTIASAKMGAAKALSGDEPDGVVIVDEAYQATYGEVATAAAPYSQILLVGDPGQIGPVVRADVAPWASMKAPPHVRAPEVFARRDGARALNLASSYRLGPVSCALLSPLYPFAFVSAGPRRFVGGLPEVAHTVLPEPDGTDDEAMLRAVASVAADRAAVSDSVAVVCARNSQVSVVRALISQAGLTGVTVGTADSLQGGEWECVVALDPLAGSTNVTDHQASPGRLCVMLSRHTVQLTWLTTAAALTLLEAHSSGSDPAVGVRRALLDTPTL